MPQTSPISAGAAASSASSTLVTDARIVTPGGVVRGSLLMEGGAIAAIIPAGEPLPQGAQPAVTICAAGAWLLPGAIDTHVHFRDPGLTEKADWGTESAAAAAGGVTSVIDMPNTLPPTISLEAAEQKMRRAAEASSVNYSCFLGAAEGNLPELLAADYTRYAGVKLFLGSTTGNMMLGSASAVEALMAQLPCLVAVHAESEEVIQRNLQRLNPQGLPDLPPEMHPEIRSAEACAASSAYIIEMARRLGTRLHLAHVSTAAELSLLDAGPAEAKRITAETCPQYLLFAAPDDFRSKGSLIKCNPAVKGAADRDALRRECATPDGRIDSIATDHAPHLPADKQGGALRAKSGMPMVQFSVVKCLDLFGPERTARLMAHAPAAIFGIEGRGRIEPGCRADVVMVATLAEPRVISRAEVLSRCGWTPLEGMTTGHRVLATWVNGHSVYTAAGGVDATVRGEALRFTPRPR